ncbi:MAG: acetylglutamate kinase [Bacteroidia bacterium]|nr:acetylglutamate kinase [Bacteroidia bacterium]
MKESLNVVKVGGKILETPKFLEAALDQFANLKGPKVLVHGGGRTATEIATKLGIEAPMVNGRRITSDEMLEVAMMVYGGLSNKRLVAKLQAKSVQALGITGADLNMIQAHKREVKDIDYGWAGDIDQVNEDVLFKLLYGGVCPVMAPLTHDGQGQMLNTNADTIASTVAVAMSNKFDVSLTFIFEKKGVLVDPDDDESLIDHIDRASFKEYVDKGQVSGGMIPKLSNAFDAIHAGVNKVLIGRYDAIASLKGNFSGTTISL